MTTLRILFVCSANLCRSVMAAEYARRVVAQQRSSLFEWRIDSAGTDVSSRFRLPVEVATEMRALGIGVGDTPRPLAATAVGQADLILTAERRHRSIVAQRFPFAVRSTYTLLQFARLLEAGRRASPEFIVMSPSDLHDLARIGRTFVQPSDDVTIDIEDPVASGSAEATRQCAHVVEGAVLQIVQSCT